jgi:protein SCO1/2
MSLNVRGIHATVMVLLAIGALFIGLFVYQHLYTVKKIDVAQFHGTYLETPRAINEFKLTGMDNKPFDNASLQGHWTLFFFGFTNCGYVCPTTMTKLAKMYRILKDKKVRELPQVVMISIDPDRDTAAKLSRYVSSFEPSFYGARGDENELESMTRELGIAYAKIANKEGNDPTGYDMQHSGALMLFNPEGQLNAFFTSPHRSDLLAKDYMLLVS